MGEASNALAVATASTIIAAARIDSDNDDVGDDFDNCPNTANADQLDNELDGLGEVCDSDDDNDGVSDTEDPFPLDPGESADTDGDGIGNNADTDDDNDGMPDTYENDNNFDPLDSSDAAGDADGDGYSNLEEFRRGTDPQNPADFPIARRAPVAIFILLDEDEE